ncbi:MAG: class I SAM-dependent methyltransferase [Alphaproteobacteria bacterium]
MLFKKTDKAVLKSLENIDCGSIRIVLHDGHEYGFSGRFPGPAAHLEIHSPDVLWNMAVGGDTAFARDYQAGKWDSDDIGALVEFAFRNDEALGSLVSGSAFKRGLVWMAGQLKPNTRRRAKSNIHAHYDLGNDFYALWLDPTMSYSSAIFTAPGTSLVKGQLAKYDRILDRLDGPAKDVLEIGCGWGGFADRAIADRDHRVTGLTISPAQAEYARQRLRTAGKQAEIRLEDYREPRGRFESIVSIEMFEAVGERYWKTYFDRLKAQLDTGGQAVIQTITIDDDYFDSYRRGGDAIRDCIFPGGLLPSEKRLGEEAARAGFRVADTYRFGGDYAETLDRWLATFDRKRKQVQDLGFDDGFIRLWRFYLASCSGAFRSGRTDVMQVELRHA